MSRVSFPAPHSGVGLGHLSLAGQRKAALSFETDPGHWDTEREAKVVGLVEDVRLTRLDSEARHTLYWPMTQLPNNFMSVVVRSEAEELRTMRRVKAS